MKAIVLTYDKYKVFAQHMIRAYQNLWPNNPFIFRIPYQEEECYLDYQSKFEDKVELIKSSSSIASTMKSLLADLDDEEWVYWCMDDRYPIELQSNEIDNIHKWVTTIDDPEISAIMFLNSLKGQKPENLYYGKFSIKDSFNNSYRRRKNYTMIWMHQFMRVKVIRCLFNNFPEDLNSAKEMDYIMFKLSLPENQKLYVLNNNLGIFGESTSRGKLTKNCYESLLKNQISLPENFEVSNKTIITGAPTSKTQDMIFWIKTGIKTLLKTKN